MSLLLNEAKADEVYDVLAKVLGASEEERGSFVSVVSSRGIREWRFQGFLGFGGKFHYDGRVSCYKEDETDERIALMAEANAALKTVLKSQNTNA